MLLTGCSVHMHYCACTLRILQLGKDAFCGYRCLGFCICVCVRVCMNLLVILPPYVKTVLLCDWVVCKWFAIVCLFKVPQKQTVPVAPRTRISPEESQLEVIHVQNRLPVLSSQLQVEEPKEQTVEGIQGHLIIFFKNLYQGMSFYNRLSREKKCF